MKYLGWILLIIFLIIGAIVYNVKYLALRNRFEQQSRETEMWMSKTEQMKRQIALNQTRQAMAPDVSLLLADVFPASDSFTLTRMGSDTLAALATELRRTRGDIIVTVFTDDIGVSLNTKLRFPDAWALAAAKAAAVTRFLQSKGVPAERMVLQAFGGTRDEAVTLPDLKSLSGRRLEIRVNATP